MPVPHGPVVLLELPALASRS